MKKLTLTDIKTLYPKYLKYYENHLKEQGVKFIKYKPKSISQALFAMMFLFKYKGEKVTKQELTEGWNKVGTPTNDFQITRHLGLQFGYYIEKSGSKIFGWYRLLTLDKPHPSFIPTRRTQTFSEEEWLDIKRSYNHRCQSCGVIEGEPHYKDMTLIAKLEKGHCDPTKPLTIDNTFPQCNYCNQMYRNKFEFDKRGNVKRQLKR